MSEPKGRGPAWPLGTVTVLGAHILDVLGRPVETIPPGQGSVAVDVLHPGRPQDLERLAPLLAVTDWFMPNGDQILALTGRRDLGPAIKDALALGGTQPAVAGRIKEHMS